MGYTYVNMSEYGILKLYIIYIYTMYVLDIYIVIVHGLSSCIDLCIWYIYTYIYTYYIYTCLSIYLYIYIYIYICIYIYTHVSTCRHTSAYSSIPLFSCGQQETTCRWCQRTSATLAICCYRRLFPEEGWRS